MNIKEITQGIYYAGVNDRVTQLFEGLWPLPFGVSYNSYIVRGADKVALIDTVRIDEVREFLANVDGAASDRKVDYLVVNHMEPDHSGSIPEVVRAFPGIKIIGNAQTVGMIKGFYHLDDDDLYIVVKDGDTIDLGGISLQFFLTPMVHWPETMMTYVAERKTLFSGDAFGCFGALNGGVVDSEMDTDRYFPEMYRYYSNIVGKYGRFVQKALEKLGALPMEYICSTHGPVWHERINEVVDLTAHLSAYKSEPGVTIVYGSMYGNTEQMAETAAATFAARGVRNIAVHNAAISDLSYILADVFTHKGLVIAAPTYSETLFPPVKSLVDALVTRGMKNRVVGLIGGHTWAPQAVKVMDSLLQATDMEIVSESVSFKQAPSADALEAVSTLAASIADRL